MWRVAGSLGQHVALPCCSTGMIRRHRRNKVYRSEWLGLGRDRRGVECASSGKDGPDPPEDENTPERGEESPSPPEREMAPELKLLVDLIVEYPATRGTIAAVLGYLVHINPLETLHWSRHDFYLGVLLALPVLAWDALIMLPNWDPPKVEKMMQLSVPRAVAEKLGDTIVPDGDVGADVRAGFVNIPVGDGVDEDIEKDLVTVERKIKVRGEQSSWKDALRRTQVDRTMNNAGQLLQPASEALLLVLVHFSEEMLYRGFGLTFAVKWTTDRLYEATGEDFVDVFGRYTVPIPTLAAAVASLSLVTVAIYLLLSRDLKSLKMLENLEKSDDASSPNKTLFEMKDTILSQQRWNIAITAVSEIVQWTSATAAFLYTGNLLAPIAGALVSDAVCSYLQRDKLKVLQQTLLADSRERLALAKESGALVRAMKKERTQAEEDTHE